MEQMQAAGFSWVETQFLRSAIVALTECRRTLMYTYAFAFYLQPSNASAIFEDNQENLELATEELSGLLENEMNFDMDLRAFKQRVL